MSDLHLSPQILEGYALTCPVNMVEYFQPNVKLRMPKGKGIQKCNRCGLRSAYSAALLSIVPKCRKPEFDGSERIMEHSTGGPKYKI